LQCVEAAGEFAIGQWERSEEGVEIDVGETGAGELGGEIAGADADAAGSEGGARFEDDDVLAHGPAVVVEDAAGAADEGEVGRLAEGAEEEEIVVFSVHRLGSEAKFHDTRAASFAKKRSWNRR
jgi:hypothetical protein